MSNLLYIPFKKTYEVDLKDAVRDFIESYGGGHPEEFKSDIQTWQNLRKTGVGGYVHVDRIKTTQLYHAQLVSIMAKFPADIDVEFPWAPVFHHDSIPISMKNIVFERAAVLFNLASLYSQLGRGEDRSKADGIKRAASHFQHAAGTLSYLMTNVLSKLTYTPEDEEKPIDLSLSFDQAMEHLMLAQAQECSWQLAKISHYGHSLISKVAARVSALYAQSAKMFQDANPPVKQLLPPHWLSHIEAKAHHFKAVAEYRKSVDELEKIRYGWELARLYKAQEAAKKAYDIARRGKVVSAVVADIQSLSDTVEKNIGRAERDNDLIYHHEVPTPATLPQISSSNLATSIVSSGLLNPKTTLGKMEPLFGELIGWGAREAINIYNDRKSTLVQEEILDVSQELQDQSDEELRKLNLPAALEALERPIGLPPSLLSKAEEVRLEDGPARIEVSIEDVRRLGQHDQEILDEAMDTLDGEASEDEAARKDISLTRPPSHEANVDLVEKAQRYRSILSQAAASDEAVRQKWDDWEECITQLTWDEAQLEASVPSSTLNSSSTTQGSSQTKEMATALRVKLEELDTLHRDRAHLVHQVRALEEADDIQPRILKVSSGFERLSELKPEMFEDILDEELAKYDQYLTMENFKLKQDDLLNEIKVINEKFLQSRRDDPSVKEREYALQSLDLAYFKYREITRNLEEGFKFYNDLAGILTQFKEVCKTWSHQRQQEIHQIQLQKPFENLSIQEAGHRQVTSQPQQTSPSPLAQAQAQPIPVQSPADDRFASILAQGPPSLNPEEWGFEDVTLPPAPRTR